MVINKIVMLYFSVDWKDNSFWKMHVLNEEEKKKKKKQEENVTPHTQLPCKLNEIKIKGKDEKQIL